MWSRAVKLIDKALDARVAPSAYLVPLQSLTFGIAFFLFSSNPSVQGSILYQVGPPFGAALWGLGVTLGTTGFIVSLWFKWKWAVAGASMFLFSVWLGAAIAYAGSHYWFQFAL